MIELKQKNKGHISTTDLRPTQSNATPLVNARVYLHGFILSRSSQLQSKLKPVMWWPAAHLSNNEHLNLACVTELEQQRKQPMAT